jgi:chromosome segregation ATPase
MPAIAAIGAAIKIGGAIFGAGRAKREARRQRKRAKALNKKINHLEANRQDVINPYDQVTSLASMATDLSSTMSNPMANLSVATKAAEMKIEQADISLANTLDTLRATGAGAGGATALAQAALQSKKGVAADIESQEKSNEDKRAAGEERLEQRVAAEKQRIQGINISEGAREQQAFAQGRNIEFQTQESRDNTKLSRLYGQQQQAQGAAAAARQSETSAIMGGINALGGAIGSGAFGGLGGGGAASSGSGTGLGGSFGGASGTGQFSSQVSSFTPSSSGSYSIGQYGTDTSSMFGG